MKYNFDEIIDRKNTRSVKWNITDDDILPMWIADMDFKTALPVIDALEKAAVMGIYGYSTASDTYYEAIVEWFDKRHRWKIEKDWVLYSTGVVPILGLLVRTLTNAGDKIVIQPPVYQAFTKAIRDNGREAVENPLKLEDGIYVIDYDDLVRKVSDERVKMLILCSPHNPVGRVWSLQELKKLGEICTKYNVLIVSDEIHCDLIYGEHKHIPFASISEVFKQNSIICTAPSKTFNLAGVKISNIIIPNENLRQKINDAIVTNGLNRISLFATEATIAAYLHGEEWLEQLIEYLSDNVNYLIEYIHNYIPRLKVIKPEGTYLVWIDCSELKLDSKELHEFFLKEAKVWLNQGHIFGENGESYVRINVACPRKLLEESLRRIQKALSKV